VEKKKTGLKQASFINMLLERFRINFSNSLPVLDRRLIGRKFWGNFGSLPGFDNVMTFASFQDFGKWDSRGQ
jgi:hypothetical protein